MMQIFTLILAISLACLFPHSVDGYSFQGNMIRDLEGEGTGFVLDASLWKFKADRNLVLKPYILCDTTYLLGGLGMSSNAMTFTKTYLNLPPHDMIYFSFSVSLNDKWKFDSGFVVFADFRDYALGMFLMHHSVPFVKNTCGGDGVNDPSGLKVYGRLKHQRPTLNFTIQKAVNDQDLPQSFGFRDLTLLFKNATEEDKVQKNQLCGLASVPLEINQCKCPEGQYTSFDGSCGKCHPLCKTCLGPSSSQCFECSDQAFFDGKECSLKDGSDGRSPFFWSDERSDEKMFLGKQF